MLDVGLLTVQGITYSREQEEPFVLGCMATQFIKRFVANGPYPEPLKACLDFQTFAPYF